jgi:transposase-like protein
VILLAVRWYLRYRLTYAEVAEWLAERGVSVDPSTIWDWVQAYAPKLNEAARAHRSPAGVRWRVDETYVKVAGRPLYLYRAIDERGQVLDCLLSDRRDTIAARLFLLWAQDRAGAAPTRVITERAGCYVDAVRAECPGAKHLTRRYLNNRLERDHQHLKGRIRPMRGFKSWRAAWTFCRAHDLVRNLRAGHSSLAVGSTPRERLQAGWAALAASL